MVGVDCVATPRVVEIVAPIGLEHVIGDILEPPEADGGATLVPLAGMAIDHIDDHLDTGAVQGLDHVAEFVHDPSGVARCVGSRCGVAPVWRKIAERRVPPVVAQALAG